MTTDNSATVEYYQQHTDRFIAQTVNVDMQDLYEAFIKQLPQQPRLQIIDVGCGSGRDAAYFANKGYQVTACDASTHLIAWARNHWADSDVDWHTLRFEDIHHQPWHQRFIGVWACASLLHVAFDELPTLIESLLMTLTEHGVMYASFKYGDGERVENGRFFCDMNEQRWQKVKSKLTVSFNDTLWLTIDKRHDYQGQWLNVLLKTT